MAKNYFNRYIWLLNAIMHHNYITFAEINELWRRSSLNEDGSDLPQRTFYNHRDSILDIFGIEIKSDKNLGYYIADDDFNENGVRNWLLTSLSVNNIVNESATLRNRIILEDIPSGQQYLTTIINAMKEGNMLEMSYHRFMDSQPFDVVIAPYCVKLFKQRWYIVAKQSDSSKPKIYALDRVKKLSQTSLKFVLPKNFNAKDYFSGWFGIVHDEVNYKPQVIRIKVWDKQRNYFRTLKLHDSQREVEITEDWSIFEYFMAPTWDLEYELLQFNDYVEVLKPESLRNSIKEHAMNIIDLYNGKWD